VRVAPGLTRGKESGCALTLQEFWGATRVGAWVYGWLGNPPLSHPTPIPHLDLGGIWLFSVVHVPSAYTVM